VRLALLPWRDADCAALFRNQLFHVSVPGHELVDVLAGDFREFGAQVNVMAEIVDTGCQAFQNKQGFIAGQDKLTGVIRQTTALKERKRHLAACTLGEARLYPSFSASLTLLSAPIT